MTVGLWTPWLLLAHSSPAAVRLQAMASAAQNRQFVGQCAERHAPGLACDFRQTNHEGVMVDWLQEAFEKDAAVLSNPAGFSVGCVPVLDALKLIRRPLVELHLTNIHQRPKPYSHSLVSQVAGGVICGFGPAGYLLAVRAVADALVMRASA